MIDYDLNPELHCQQDADRFMAIGNSLPQKEVECLDGNWSARPLEYNPLDSPQARRWKKLANFESQAIAKECRESKPAAS